jgi:hypothetical protein
MSQDSYTATEAGQVLGLSTKRVRQLVAEKKLKAIPKSTPLRIEAESVHRERKRRGDSNLTKPALNTGSLVDVLLQIEEARQAGYAQALEHSARQITAIEDSAQYFKDELLREQAERRDLYNQLLEAQTRLGALEAQGNKRGIFRRN